MKKLKHVDGCEDCEKVRSIPVKAWAVVNGKIFQMEPGGHYTGLIVRRTKAQAKRCCYLAGDRVAKIEIREVFE